MGDLDSEWQRKGATLSDKTARTESDSPISFIELRVYYRVFTI